MSDRIYFKFEDIDITPIPGFMDYYASREGFVYSAKLGTLVQKSIYKGKDGYDSVGLIPNGSTGKKKTKRYRLQTIICTTFHPNPEKKLTVNHKDGNGRNNHADNLEWMTQSEQMQHAHDTGLINQFVRPVVQADEHGNKIAEFEKITDAADETGINGSTITSCCKGIARTAGGYAWYYKENFVGQKLRPIKTGAKKVHQYDLEGNFIREFESSVKAAESVGLSPSSMPSILKGEKKSKGYIWKYAPVTVNDPYKEYRDWVELDEFPKYKISRDGRVFSEKQHKELRLNGKKTRVQTVCLVDNTGTERSVSVHQLVGRAYIPNPEGYPLLKHLDNDPSNNRVENLEWDDCSGNGLDAFRDGINTGTHPVIRLDFDTGVELEHYISVNEAARSIGIGRKSILNAINGTTESCCGYGWVYAKK